MKNILKILFLIGLSGNFLIAAKMYNIVPGGANFSLTTDVPDLRDAFLVVGVTNESTANNGIDEWKLTDAKLNPVFKLNADFMSEHSIGAAPGYYFLAYILESGGTTTKTYGEVALTSIAEEQYTGQPLFMLYDAWPSTAGDYKGDSIPTGEVALRFFPVLDMSKFNDATTGGAYFDYYYKIEGQSTWTKCNTITTGPNGAVSTETQVFGDLTDHLPVETVWDAKTDLGTDFNEDIVVRIRAKYGTDAFPSAPTDSSPSNPSPDSGETYVLKTGGNNIGVLDTEATEDFNSDGSKDGLDKIMQVVQASGLENVGTYNEGGSEYSVFYFTADALESFSNGAGKSAGNYAAYGTQLVEVELGSTEGV
jgi:hypothetical protein